MTDPKEPHAGGGGGRSENGRAAYGGSNPSIDPFTTGGEAALRHQREVRERTPGAGEPIAAGERDGAEQPPASIVGERQQATADAIKHGTADEPHEGFTGEANEAEVRMRVGLPPTAD